MGQVDGSKNKRSEVCNKLSGKFVLYGVENNDRKFPFDLQTRQTWIFCENSWKIPGKFSPWRCFHPWRLIADLSAQWHLPNWKIIVRNYCSSSPHDRGNLVTSYVIRRIYNDCFGVIFLVSSHASLDPLDRQERLNIVDPEHSEKFPVFLRAISWN